MAKPKAAKPKTAAKSKPPAKKKAPARKAAKKKAATGSRKPSASERAATTASRAKAGAGDSGNQGALFAPDPAIADILDERLLVPQKVAALAFDISIEALRKWKIRPRHHRGRETLYYLPDLIKHRLERADATENALYSQRARLARAQSEKTELEVAELRGELIRASDVLAAWEPIAGATRQKVLGIKTKLAQRIPTLTDSDLKTIDEICRATLEELANGGNVKRRTRKSTRANI